MRCKIISKKWLDLANPDRPDSCRSLHFKSNPSPSIGFFVGIPSPPRMEWRPTDSCIPNCHPSFENYELHFTASSNGFILFYDWRNFENGTPRVYDYYVANPFTNHCVKLPPLHPSEMGYAYSRGLGVKEVDEGPAHFTVAVICIDSHWEGVGEEEGWVECQHVKMFSSSDNGGVPGWRDICLKYSGGLQHYDDESQPPVFEVNDVPAAVLHDRVFFWSDDSGQLVVSCDLNEKRYWAIDVPPSKSMYSTVSLRVVKDHLYCGIQGLHDYADIKVWTFEGDLFHYDCGGRWVLNHVVDVLDLRRFPQIDSKVSFEELHLCNPWIVFFSLGDKNDKFMSYEAKSGGWLSMVKEL